MAAFDSTLIARAAAALYDTQLGSATMHEALDAVNGNAFGSVDALLNALYQRDFGAWTDEAVAAMLVANVGITGAAAVAEATSVITGALAASAAGQKGTTVNALLNAFAGLTGNATFGGAATAFNAQVRAAVAYAQDPDSTDVSASSTTGMVFTLVGLEANGVDVMRITGDQDVRIDFTNPNNQVVGLDLDGDGTIEFNGSERSVRGVASGYEIVDAYSRNPLNHDDTANNFLGDIHFDGTSWHGTEGDGQNTDGNIFLGGLGVDTALGGVGNDFLAGGGIAQDRWDDLVEHDADGDGDGDHLYGGRNADFFFAEFSLLDIVDGNGHDVLYVDGGNTSDDAPAGTFQTDQDNDWLLIEASDDDEPVLIELTEGDGQGTDQDDASEVATRTGQYMDIEDVENLDASGNLYGFLDDMTDGAGNQLRIGGRSYDSRYDDGALQGSSNYGIGSSAQLDITGTDVGNIIIAGYDNDEIDAEDGDDLVFGGNLQQLFETVEGGATNVNLAGITLDGMDFMTGGDGADGLVWEGDGGFYDGEGDVDTLWLTNYALGTNTVADSTTDGWLRFDLGSQADASDDDADAEPGYAGYGGANRALNADQTNYSGDTDVSSTDVDGIEIVDASGLSTGVRGLDYFAAGTNESEDAADDPAFSNRQNFDGYNGRLDLRGALNTDNNLYAGAGDDVLEGRGGDDAARESSSTYDQTQQGGDGNDDFYYALDGDDGGDETNVVRRKVDANGDGWWDGSDADGTVGTWGGDFGQNTVTPGESVLTIAITIGDAAVQISDAVNFISEIVTGVENEDGSFTEIVLNSAAIRAAQTYDALAEAINDEIAAEYPDEADNIVAAADGFSVVITDAEGRTLADDVAQVPGAGVTANQKANTDSGNIFVFGDPINAVSQDRIIFKSYEDRSDNEGVDDDAITGSEISLGEDAYAEDLVVSFGADGTRIAEDQEYTITFRNLTTQDSVTVSVNGVTYTQTVGVANNGSLIDQEDTRHYSLEYVQTAFLERFSAFINSFMDDDTAAGQVTSTVPGFGTDVNADGDFADSEDDLGIDIDGDAVIEDDVFEYTPATTLTLTQVAYHDGEENVFMNTPVVTVTNGSGGEAPSVRAVDNDAQTEVFLYMYDGRDGNLNSTNVLFWGQEATNRSVLQTAADAGDEITGLDALVIDGGHGAGDDDLDDEDGDDIPHNLATDDGEIDWAGATQFQEENFAAHGDDYLHGGDGDDVIGGRTGDDRVRGSLGNDELDGGKDWYAVLEVGNSDYRLEYLNAHEADERDEDNDVLDIQLILQTEDGHSLLEPTDESPDETYEAYFDDTLIYHQADFTAGVTRFTITLDNYAGEGEEIEFDEGGAGTVGVDANGDGTVEADNVSTFTEFENIRTVSGVGNAVAGTNGGQGRDTLNVQALSDDADYGVLYDLTGQEAGDDNETMFENTGGGADYEVESTGGDVILLENTEETDDDADDVDDLLVDSHRQMIKVDGVENVIFGDGHDVLLIDETEAAKDNEITGDDGYDQVEYLNHFDNDGDGVLDADEADDEPTVTINVGSAHVEGSNGSHDEVEMTEGRVGSVVATDELDGVEELTLGNNTAGGEREDDTLNVENLSAGASVNYITGEIFSDTDGDLDFGDGVLQLTVNNLYEVEFVVADGEDAVVVADSDIMSDNQRTDDDEEDLIIDSHLNFDLVDRRGDTPERLTVAQLRGIDDDADDESAPGAVDEGDTADSGEIPEGYNFAQFVFALGQDTDTVDYSESDDAIAAIIDLETDDDTQFVMVDSDGDDFDGVAGDEEDRIDALVEVEQVVASQGESVLDFTASESAIQVTFQYTIDEDAVLDADDGYSETSLIRIADGEGDQVEGVANFIERYTADDGDVTNATWNRLEFGDADDMVIYEGSEDLTDQFGVDHRFSDDTINMRGGDNTASYSPLETSITATIEVTAFDEDDPTAPQIEVEIEFQDGDEGDLDTADADHIDHVITSYAADNELAAGSLKLEASQDAEDTVEFVGDTSQVFVVGQSPGVLSVSVGDAGAMLLTGFERLQDNEDTDDVYDFQDLDNIFGDLTLLDGTADDQDTVLVNDEVLDFWSDGAIEDYHDDNSTAIDVDNVVSLEMINDYFAFDFDVLDITAMTEDDLVIFGDDDDQDDGGVDNADEGDVVPLTTDDDASYEDMSADDLADANGDGVADVDRDDGEDDGDALIVGDLGLIDSLGFDGEDDANFDAIWFTDASLEDGDEFVLDTDADDYVLEDGSGDEYFTIYGAIAGANDLEELNFSLVSDPVSVTIDGAGGVSIVGTAGDDTLTGDEGDDTFEGGDGDDTIDGGVIPAEGATLTVTIGGVGTTSGTAAGVGTVTIAGLTLTADATIDSETDVGENADADQIGAAFEAVAIATWAAALDAAGLTTAEAESLVDVSYDSTSNELVFTFDAGTDGSTITDADLLAANTPADAGDATLNIGSEAATAFDDEDNSADRYVFGKTAAANGADTILNFDATDALDFTAFATDDAPVAEVLDTSGAAVVVADNDVLLVSDADGSINTAAEVLALFGAGKAFAAVPASADIVIAVRDTTADGDTTLWYIDNDATAALTAAEITLVGTLVDYNTVLVDGNIVD